MLKIQAGEGERVKEREREKKKENTLQETRIGEKKTVGLKLVSQQVG